MLKFKNWNIEEITGYHPQTTAYMDFSIAEPFGEKAIVNTFKKLCLAFKGNYKQLTELTMALNWKIFEHYETNRTMAKTYDTLWREMDRWCMENFKGEELEYYIRTTD